MAKRAKLIDALSATFRVEGDQRVLTGAGTVHLVHLTHRAWAALSEPVDLRHSQILGDLTDALAQPARAH